MTALLLRQKGYEDFLPLYKVRRRWSDRTKEVEKPLFSGYLFCFFDPNIGAPIITTPGVIRIIGNGKSPIAVSLEEIEVIRRLINSGLNTQPWPYLQAGQFVRIEEGPLQGLLGVILNIKNSYRMIVSVSLLQRSVSVEIDRDWVTPIPSKSVPCGRIDPFPSSRSMIHS
jgi:transcription antitermination factor NusG